MLSAAPGAVRRAANAALGARALSTPLRLEITSLSNRGAGVAIHDGLVVFVDGAAPGDVLTARITSRKRRSAQASLVAIERPSPDRRAPACEYFGRCGGCQYQHLSLAAQRRWKRQHVVDAWRRIAFPGRPLAETRALVGDGDAEIRVAAVVGTDDETGYRDKLTPRSDGVATGFAGEGGRLVDVAGCLLARESINETYAEMRASKTPCFPLLRLSEDGSVAVAPETRVTRRIDGLVYGFRADGFFQINAGVAELLVRHVVDTCAGFSRAVDAYCGAGLFAVSLAAAHGYAVDAVEVSPSSIDDARLNAAANGVENVRFLAADAADFRFSGSGADAVVVVDPPRAGLDDRFLKRLLAFAPRRVVYVSCEPATQARDAAKLLAGPYRCSEVAPFDMFPNTRHVETCAVFDRL